MRSLFVVLLQYIVSLYVLLFCQIDAAKKRIYQCPLFYDLTTH